MLVQASEVRELERKTRIIENEGKKVHKVVNFL